MLEEKLWEGPLREIIWCKFRGLETGERRNNRCEVDTYICEAITVAQ